MTWVMSSEALPAIQYLRGKVIKFYIGNLPIVEMTFQKDGEKGYRVVATYPDRIFTHSNMSAAMKHMHERLNSPPPEGAEIGKQAKQLHTEQQPAAPTGDQEASSG